MIAHYSAEIKIVIFQSVSERQRDEWRSSSNCGRIAAKIANFNSINSDIIGRKFTKFGSDEVQLLPLKLLKADLWSAIVECWSRVKVVPCDVYEHLPYLTGCHSNVPWATAKRIFEESSPLMPLRNLWSRSRYVHDILRYLAWYANFCHIATKGAIVNSVNSEVSGPNVTEIAHGQLPLRNRKNWIRSRKFTQIPCIWWKDRENRSSRYTEIALLIVKK